MDVAIVGGGICGLSLALNLKERGIACRVYERAPEIKELGVGISCFRMPCASSAHLDWATHCSRRELKTAIARSSIVSGS